MGRGKTPKELAVAFGSIVRNLRKSRNWTQRQLSESTGLATGYISDLENGKTGASLYVLWLLSLSFQVDWNTLKPENW